MLSDKSATTSCFTLKNILSTINTLNGCQSFREVRPVKNKLRKMFQLYMSCKTLFLKCGSRQKENCQSLQIESENTKDVSWIFNLDPTGDPVIQRKAEQYVKKPFQYCNIKIPNQILNPNMQKIYICQSDMWRSG